MSSLLQPSLRAAMDVQKCHLTARMFQIVLEENLCLHFKTYFQHVHGHAWIDSVVNLTHHKAITGCLRAITKKLMSSSVEPTLS